MKRIVFAFASITALTISCTANPTILPEPPNTTGVGGLGGNGGAGGMDASLSVTSNSASGSSGSPLSGDGSGTRLKRYVYKSDDGALVDLSYFYDTTLGIRCSPLDTPSGKRCVDIGSVVGELFYDSACTLRAAFVTKGCLSGTYATTTETIGAACANSAIYHVHTIGTKQVSGFAFNGNTCAPWTQNQANAFDVYELGPEVDYAKFAAVTLEHE